MATDEEQQAEEIDEGEAVEIDEEPALDLEALRVEAQRRYDKMTSNPNRKGNPDLTYSAQVLGVTNGVDSAVSNSLRSDAEVWAAKSDAAGIGQVARKHLLASKVLNGDFDA